MTEVHVWHKQTESLDHEAIRRAEQVLDPEERARNDRFRFPHLGRDYTAAHSLLRHALSSRFPSCAPEDWRFDTDSLGKPHLLDSPSPTLDFSLTHTHGFVACAIADCPVGIDAEAFRPNFDYASIAESVFSPAERPTLAALPEAARPARILDLWTLREAFLKATGRGLSLPLESLSFTLGDPILPTLPPEFAALPWHFTLTHPVPGVSLALALHTPGTPNISFQ